MKYVLCICVVYFTIGYTIDVMFNRWLNVSSQNMHVVSFPSCAESRREAVKNKRDRAAQADGKRLLIREDKLPMICFELF